MANTFQTSNLAIHKTDQKCVCQGDTNLPQNVTGLSENVCIFFIVSYYVSTVQVYCVYSVHYSWCTCTLFDTHAFKQAISLFLYELQLVTLHF